jgi:F0F1-type ATP synthase assembly protein I
MNKIKKIIMDIMVTTGSALMLLAIFAVINGGKSIYIETFFQVFGANIVIHLGLILTKKFESTFAALEFMLDISYTIAVLVIFGLVFDWYSSIPVWYLVIMAVVVYAFGFFINIVRIQKSAGEFNKLLQKRKNKNSNTVT